jgi:WhiB family redox-sensing transcriptional regulator
VSVIGFGSQGCARIIASPLRNTYASVVDVTAGDVRPLLAILAGDSVLTTHLEWQREGLCAEVGLELFFLEKGSHGSREARSVCAACPVRRECVTDALEHMEDCGPGLWGVWGGTSPQQRHWLQRNFGGDVEAAVSYAMEQDCTIETVGMQPRKVAAA